MKYNPLDKLFRSVIPVAYDDSISYYEMVSKVIEVMQQYIETSSITYADPFQWNITSQYARNTLVIDPETGTAYLSLQPVPQGIQITNTDYWTPVFTLQNFVEPLKKAISDFPQQEIGQGATQEIPQGTVFWAGDTLCYASQTIPIGTLVIPGSNCQATTVEELINSIFSSAYAVYNSATTAIELGWVRQQPSQIVSGDVHTYTRSNETITITGRA